MNGQTPGASNGDTALAIICGGGSLPFALADAAGPPGPLGARMPGEQDRAGIARGLALLNATSPFDIGQAVVVASNHVLALEGPEGTDQMLARVAELRRNWRINTPAGFGVLVKAAK